MNNFSSPPILNQFGKGLLRVKISVPCRSSHVTTFWSVGWCIDFKKKKKALKEEGLCVLHVFLLSTDGKVIVMAGTQAALLDHRMAGLQGMMGVEI